MAEEQFFKGPSEEEVIDSFRKQGVDVSRYKAASVIVCGISEQPAEGTSNYPILYTLATYTQDLHKWFPRPEILREYGKWGPYWQSRAYTEDVEELPGIQDGEKDYLRPHYMGPEKGWQDYEGFVEKMRATPSEAFSESYDPKETLDFEKSFNVGDIAARAKWYLQGKGTIFRQSTGKFYNPDKHSSPALLLGQLTKTIRDIIWTMGAPGTPKAGHKPFHRVDGDELHQMIFDRLQTATILSKLLKFAQTENIEAGYIDYKVMIVSPEGINRFFDSVEQALTAVNVQLVQEIQQILPQGEPMAAAANFSKDQVKTLIAAADILDQTVPQLAQLIDKAVAAPQESISEDFRKADFVAALVRVADKLDNSGNSEAASLADKLLQSITESERLTDSLNM